MDENNNCTLPRQLLNHLVESTSRVFVIGSRPNVGKTRLAISAAWSNKQIRSLFLSYEHSAEFYHCLEENPVGMINNTWNKDKYHYETGDISVIQFHGLSSIGGRFISHLHQELEEILIGFLKRNPVDVIWLDYIQLIDHTTNLLSKLKQMADDIGFKIVLLSSMGKESEHASNEKMVPNGFLWSEQFADFVDEWIHLKREDNVNSVNLSWLNGQRQNQSLTFRYDEQRGLFF